MLPVVVVPPFKSATWTKVPKDLVACGAMLLPASDLDHVLGVTHPAVQKGTHAWRNKKNEWNLSHVAAAAEKMFQPFRDILSNASNTFKSEKSRIVNFGLLGRSDTEALADICGMVGKVYAQATRTYELGQFGARSWAWGTKRVKYHQNMHLFPRGDTTTILYGFV